MASLRRVMPTWACVRSSSGCSVIRNDAAIHPPGSALAHTRRASLLPRIGRTHDGLHVRLRKSNTGLVFRKRWPYDADSNGSEGFIRRLDVIDSGHHTCQGWATAVSVWMNRPGSDGDLVQTTSRSEVAVERF